MCITSRLHALRPEKLGEAGEPGTPLILQTGQLVTIEVTHRPAKLVKSIGICILQHLSG